MNQAVENTSNSLWSRWSKIPLYWRILVFMLIGVGLGVAMGEHALIFKPVSEVILQLLAALAPPLILMAVVHVLMTSDIPRSAIFRLGGLLILNTLVAICIGLGVANLLRPGVSEDTQKAAEQQASEEVVKRTEEFDAANELAANPLGELLGKLPKSLLGPLGDSQNVIGVIVIAVAFGIALRKIKDEPIGTIQELIEIAYKTLLIVLHWIIELVPLGVLCVVASVVGEKGFEPFIGLAWFVLAVLLGLFLQTCWYLLRIQFFSWASPWKVLIGMRDALVMAFSTGSSTASMPVTYACLKDKVGVREKSASLGSLVGANFNNDGTALYEAMAALFVAQLYGIDLGFPEQLTIVFTSIIASVGAAGIPEAGVVTMMLVFNAVGLPLEAISMLLAVDWFLDRCRTTINVIGDVNVSCMLDGRTPQSEEDEKAAVAVAG